MSKFSKYHKVVVFLEGLNNIPLHSDYLFDRNKPIAYLKRMRYFLTLLGNPDKGLKFIHIAGTSGKGSVTNSIHEILTVAGEKVGSFTSPSVTTAIERIKVNDKYIHPNEFADIVTYLQPFIDEAHMKGPYGRPSYFEICLAIALIFFQKQKCAWVILEVGLGGRYDATNVIENSAIDVLTNIDLDHTEILGKTLKKIAYDKAGIIKDGSMVFTAEQRPSLLKIFSNICKEKNATLQVLPRNLDYRERNRDLVIAVTRYLSVANKHIVKGLKSAKMPCRYEIVDRNPTVILDGAHNSAKIKAVIDDLKKTKFRKLHLIIGIADDKDHIAILQQIIPWADHVFFTRFQNRDRKCADPKALAMKAKRYLKKRVQSEILLDPEGALSSALGIAKSDDLILVTGSFYLAGELRERWYPEELVLEKRKSFKK
jgi:dihydrofolate synthase/folylpolyglutamate synthase